MISRRFKTLIVAPLLLAILLGLAAVAFQRHYRRQLWDPLAIAKVNGQPLLTSALEEVMSLGYHQPMAEDGQGQAALWQILDGLIDEELVRQAAEREGLKVDPAELGESLAEYRSSFGCQADPGQAVCQDTMGGPGEALAKAVEKRLLLKAMGELVYLREGQPSGAEWRKFFRQWLAKYSLSKIYRVRVLLAQDSQEGREILASGPRRGGGLEGLAARLREAGLEARVAGPLSINLMAPETYRRYREAGLGLELAKAMGKGDKTTGPIRLAGSLAVFEVIEAIRPMGPDELAQAAKNEYERQVGERAFGLWLARLRETATIELNPSLLESGQEGTLSGLGKPKVPWQALTPWEGPAAAPNPEDPLPPTQGEDPWQAPEASPGELPGVLLEAPAGP
ncbi:MAG: SurA N-terminal domain-containing protein [Deltaproteobacteria bacterium]|nr:SurA N-terminal domain-containing protein [Deltaproteobacteria bacterium]